MIFIIQKTIVYMIPLLIVALAGMFAERSGIINLALEGTMIFGAFIAAMAVYNFQIASILVDHPQIMFLVAMIIAALAGAIYSLLLSFSAINLKADQTIGGTALNMLAPALVNTLALKFFNQEKIVMPLSTKFVLINEDASGFLKIFIDKAYISTYVMILVYIVLSIWLFYSKLGTHIRACGENPQAADSVGINVAKMRYIGTTISGALAGCGGYIYIATTAGGTAESSVAGMGFLALAIMIFGNWDPKRIAIGALIFGFLRCIGSVSSSIDILKNLTLPMYFYNIIPYFIVLVVLVFTSRKSGCPKAEGIPYDKGKR